MASRWLHSKANPLGKLRFPGPIGEAIEASLGGGLGGGLGEGIGGGFQAGVLEGAAANDPQLPKSLVRTVSNTPSPLNEKEILTTISDNKCRMLARYHIKRIARVGGDSLRNCIAREASHRKPRARKSQRKKFLSRPVLTNVECRRKTKCNRFTYIRKKCFPRGPQYGNSTAILITI